MEKLVRENVEVDSNSKEANIEAEDQECDHAINWHLQFRLLKFYNNLFSLIQRYSLVYYDSYWNWLRLKSCHILDKKFEVETFLKKFNGL